MDRRRVAYKGKKKGSELFSIISDATPDSAIFVYAVQGHGCVLTAFSVMLWMVLQLFQVDIEFNVDFFEFFGNWHYMK
jgi:hypothetical protein